MTLLSHHHTEERPWGSFEQFTLNEPTTVKILHVLPGLRFSLQTHAKRSEFWKVLNGSGEIEIGEKRVTAHAGDTFEIPEGAPHRCTGGPEGITLLEIAFGTFDENDITRIEDDFGRAKTP